MSLKDFISYGSSIMDVFHDGVVIVDRQGFILFVNHANARITGMDRKDILGKPVQDIVSNSHILQALQTGSPIADVTTRVGDKVVISNIVPIYDENNCLTGAVSIFRDLTETLNLNRRLFEAENVIEELKERLSKSQELMDHGMIIGNSPTMQKATKLAKKAADVTSTVMIEGESGTGKEVMARFIHLHSERRNKPFMAISCASLPESLLESELFGYEEGAFSGAKRGGKPGLFELAHGGTLFLDELEDLSLSVQAKLLRVIQFKELYRVGGTKVKTVDVRILTASNQNLDMMVQQKKFREDLYYRLHVVRIELPPLRERKEDLPLFIQHQLERLGKKLGKQIQRVDSNALRLLMSYDYPGNIRELENILELSLILDDNQVLDVEDLPERLSGNTLLSEERHSDPSPLSTIQDMERNLIAKALQIYPNKSDAAKTLGITRATLYRKIQTYGLHT